MATLKIDADRCQGHALCGYAAPSLVDIDDLGFAFLTGDGTIRSDAEMAEAERARDGCPEQAITIVDSEA